MYSYSKINVHLLSVLRLMHIVSFIIFKRSYKRWKRKVV